MEQNKNDWRGTFFLAGAILFGGGIYMVSTQSRIGTGILFGGLGLCLVLISFTPVKKER
jgi:hypothetical protein